MIKLTRSQRPEKLTEDFVREQTALFEQDGKNVWNKPFIKEALLEMSSNKCAYCECTINEESAFLEVEHFLPKKFYPQQVLNWENLLPSCKRCNGKKGEHNTGEEPIINPCEQDPKDHLSFQAYRLYDKTTLGRTSIDLLNLNDSQRLVMVRFRIGNGLTESLEELLDRCHEYADNPIVRRRNQIIHNLEVIMRLSLPSSEYSATMATVLLGLNRGTYEAIKAIFKEQGLWNEEFAEMERKIELIRLDQRSHGNN